MTDKLIEIPSSEWAALRDLYLVNWPNNIIGYYTIDNYIRWTEKQTVIPHLRVCSLNDDWSDGTFLIVDRYQLFINSLNDNLDRLTTALSLLDWSKGLKISSTCVRHRPAVTKVIDALGLTREFDSVTSTYYMPRDKAAQFQIECPPGIVLRPMSIEHALVADAVWPNRHVGSLFFLRRLIEWNPNIGAFTDDENNRLVAWCFRLQAGPLGALQVDTEYLNRGLGSLVCKAMSKKLADLNMDTFALVGPSNTASVRMFEKLGFKRLEDSFWLRTDPTVPFQWSDD